MDGVATDERQSGEVADDGDGDGTTTERETETEIRDGDWRVRKREGWRDSGVREDEEEEDEVGGRARLGLFFFLKLLYIV